MIIEPCCCHKQLPQLIKANPNRLVSFHTNGDVTIEKVLHAVLCLTGESVLTLITPNIATQTAQYLNYALSRNWLTSINVLTEKDDKRITESSSLLILEGFTHRLAITGYLPCLSPADTDNRYRLVNHTMLYTAASAADDLWRDLTHIPTAPFRTRR